MSFYLDCNATTPLDSSVQAVVWRHLVEEFGNAGSRTHEYGTRAKQAVQMAREQVASLARCKVEEVIFTSGATESNNLAILGLAEFGLSEGRRHLISTSIEHKAVLEPLQELERRGFELTLLDPSRDGSVSAEQVKQALRPDTLLVSIMHVNNETGVIQPLEAIAGVLEGHSAFLHVDAAQGFGKLPEEHQHTRIDLLSLSGHKLYAPKGVGALITRRRGFKSPPLKPLQFGGGQERGLRPGTVPVHLVAGLGEAAHQASLHWKRRQEACRSFQIGLLEAFKPLHVHINGDLARTVTHTLNLSVPGVNSEAAMVALKGIVAISNGSACTSQAYVPSHVLKAMGLDEERIREALRISWCHLTEPVDWRPVVEALRSLQ